MDIEDMRDMPIMGKELYKLRRIHRVEDLIEWLRKLLGDFDGGGPVTGDYMPLPTNDLNGMTLVVKDKQWIRMVPPNPAWAGKIIVMKDGEWVEMVPADPATDGEPLVYYNGKFVKLSDHTTVVTGKNYRHSQVLPMATWTINHGMGLTDPTAFDVLVTDMAKHDMVGGVDRATATANYFQITFSRAVSGTALVSAI